MPKILSVDAGFRTGWAVVEPGRPPITGSTPIPGSADALGLACHHFGHLVKHLIEEHQPTDMVICTPFVGAFSFKTKTGLKRMTPNIDPIKVVFGLYGMAKAVAHTQNIVIHDLYEPSVRAAFDVRVPRGTPKKKRHKVLKGAVIEKCREYGWLVKDDHAGDALLAAVYMLGRLMPQLAHMTTPLFAGRKKSA